MVQNIREKFRLDKNIGYEKLIHPTAAGVLATVGLRSNLRAKSD